MGFCSFSSQLIVENKTQIENLFITSYMPYAPGECVKVYLYGLLFCSDSNQAHNNISEFAKALNLTEQDIESAFVYWQEQGLVQIIDTIPMEIKYLPINQNKYKHQKIKDDKYTSFNVQVQEILSDRMIMPNEFYEYYVTMESLHIEQAAMLMIIKYCTNLKGKNVNYPYILTVAKNWAHDGYTTAESIQEKLEGYEKQNAELELITKAMGIKRPVDAMERDLYTKWQQMGFNEGTVIFVVKMLKKSKNSVNFNYLDAIFDKYYKMHLFDCLEIDEYEKNKKELNNLSKTICKNLGVFYEDVEPVTENYTQNWKSLGYDEETLEQISTYCFKSNIRTLDYMDKQIQKFYKLGIVNKQSLNEYFLDVLSEENEIKEILTKLGQNRNVNSYDRECYNNWKNNWNCSNELIEKAIEKSIGNPKPMQVMNKYLALWFTNGYKTASDIKDEKPTKTLSKNYETREYTTEEISKLFTNLEEIDI